jgi:predicted nucleic acid-binding protein
VIGYLDTSAFVPLLVVELSTPLCRRFWDDADAVVSCRLLYVEAAAALAQAVRIGRLTGEERRSAATLLDELWDEFEVVEVDEFLVREAADLAQCYALRGYDAVHCASAQQLDDDDVVVAAGDRRLLTAWTALGMSTLDTSQDGTEGVPNSNPDHTAVSYDEYG